MAPSQSEERRVKSEERRVKSEDMIGTQATKTQRSAPYMAPSKSEERRAKSEDMIGTQATKTQCSAPSMAPSKSEERRVKSEDMIGTQVTKTQHTSNIPNRQKPHPSRPQAVTDEVYTAPKRIRDVVPFDGWVFDSERDCGRTALRLGRPYNGFGTLHRLMNGSSNPEQAFPFGEGGTAAGRDG